MGGGSVVREMERKGKEPKVRVPLEQNVAATACKARIHFNGNIISHIYGKASALFRQQNGTF